MLVNIIEANYWNKQNKKMEVNKLFRISQDYSFDLQYNALNTLNQEQFP